MLGMEIIVEIVGLAEKLDIALIDEIPCVTKTDGGGSVLHLVDEVLVTSVNEVLIRASEKIEFLYLQCLTQSIF